MIDITKMSDHNWQAQIFFLAPVLPHLQVIHPIPIENLDELSVWYTDISIGLYQSKKSCLFFCGHKDYVN